MAQIYVGNLSFSTTETELQEAFSAYGAVSSVSLIKDRDTGRPRGFAFVEMPDKAQATAAIAGLNLQQVGGRSITVNEARPREERPRQSGGRSRNNW